MSGSSSSGACGEARASCFESNREAAALIRKTRAAQRRTIRMEAAYGKRLSAAFSDGLGDARSSGEAETERDWALVGWVSFCVAVVASYVLWGEALVRYLLAVAPV